VLGALAKAKVRDAVSVSVEGSILTVFDFPQKILGAMKTSVRWEARRLAR
jgi:hypothetical protein